MAYRYFATPKRKFIIADTPGHIQYTRNMVTGASTANLALVLVDARKGMVEQSRRHAFLASLLRVPHLVLCVNKMDLVDYDKAVFNRIKDEFRDFAAKLDIGDLSFIPMSALNGDNVVHRSENMPWYEGSSLLHHLEDVHIASDRNLIDVRFPVQYVIRPQSERVPRLPRLRRAGRRRRAEAGRRGDGPAAAGSQTTIAGIDTADGPVDEAYPPMSVTVRLTDEIDISRGDMICRPQNQPHVSQDIDAMVCWMTEQPSCGRGGMYAIKHTTRTVRAQVHGDGYRLDVNTLHRDRGRADTWASTRSAGSRLRTTQPLFVDEYRAQPHHRFVHPHRRGHRRDRRRRNDSPQLTYLHACTTAGPGRIVRGPPSLSRDVGRPVVGTGVVVWSNG